MKNIPLLSQIAFIVLLIVGVNAGLYGLFSIDLISLILGNLLARLFYFLAGCSAGYIIYLKVMKIDSP